jgi:hypothetical protein
MSRWLCRLGRHDWQLLRNPDVAGPEAEYDQCRRCGKERKAYGKPPPTGAAGG